jgi:RNA polymerase sigma factor (sigma-70 family)
VAALARSTHLAKVRSLDLRGHRCWCQQDHGRDVGGIAELAGSPLLGQLRRLLLGPRGPSNGWTAQVLSDTRPSRRLELVPSPSGWMDRVLRGSRYLIPSQLLECDLEELWWLGDTDKRDQPLSAPWVAERLDEYPDLLDRMDRRQATVLRMRYGQGEGRKTLKQIGEHLGMPPERVRDIEHQAVETFRGLWRDLRFQ